MSLGVAQPTCENLMGNQKLLHSRNTLYLSKPCPHKVIVYFWFFAVVVFLEIGAPRQQESAAKRFGADNKQGLQRKKSNTNEQKQHLIKIERGFCSKKPLHRLRNGRGN